MRRKGSIPYQDSSDYGGSRLSIAGRPDPSLRLKVATPDVVFVQSEMVHSLRLRPSQAP